MNLMYPRPACPTGIRGPSPLVPERHVYVFSWREGDEIASYERTVDTERTALERLDQLARQTGCSGFYFINHIPPSLRYWR